MTIEVEAETLIGRRPADVFGALSAVERYPEWLIASGIVRVEPLDPGPLQVGSRLRISASVAGQSALFESAVTALEPGSRFAISGRDPQGVTIELDAHLIPGNDDGSTTRLQWSLKMGLPLRYRMFESMVAAQAKRAAALDLEALKRRLESAAR